MNPRKGTAEKIRKQREVYSGAWSIADGNWTFRVCVFPAAGGPWLTHYPDIQKDNPKGSPRERRHQLQSVGLKKGSWLSCNHVPNSFPVRVKELPRGIPSVLRNEQRKKNGTWWGGEWNNRRVCFHRSWGKEFRKLMVVSLPWSTKWIGQRLTVLPRECTGHSKHSLSTTQEMTLHMNITRWPTPKSDWLFSL